MTRRLNLKSNANLHNKFHFVLTDAKTGKVKQEGWAYNVMTNGGISALVEALRGYASSVPSSYATGQQCFNKWARTIVVGSGDAAPAATDTALDSQVGSSAVGEHYASEMDQAAGTASHTRKAVWDETLIQNTSIKEVGFHSGSVLISRALIKDSEGTPITINKGTLDILTVYATIYIELVNAYSDRVIWVNGSPTQLGISGGAGAAYNGLLTWIAGDGSITCSSTSGGYNVMALSVGKSSDNPVYTDQACKDQLQAWGASTMDTPVEDCIYADTTNRRLEVNHRVGAAECNAVDGIWEFGICMWMYQCGVSGWGGYGWRSLLRAVVPIVGVWDDATLTDEELGTGDGSTTVFSTTWSPVLSGTYTVKVDGMTQTETTDYTINTTSGEITFVTAPGNGLAVTATYDIEQIPKDSNHVLDISFSIQFADGSA